MSKDSLIMMNDVSLVYLHYHYDFCIFFSKSGFFNSEKHKKSGVANFFPDNQVLIVFITKFCEIFKESQTLLKIALRGSQVETHINRQILSSTTKFITNTKRQDMADKRQRAPKSIFSCRFLRSFLTNSGLMKRIKLVSSRYE